MHKQQDAEEPDLLGKLCPGEKKLGGKTFYLDNVKRRQTALLLEAISLLGGRVESFLHKDVNFVVTGSQEGLKEERHTITKAGGKRKIEAQHPIKQQESVLTSEKKRPETPRPMVCGSRGKALLEKAIRNNERLKGNSVLANARSWGVKILYVDDVLLYLKHLTRESFGMKHKKPERPYTKQHGPHVVKAAALKSPFLKIEDSSRKYKPLHMQSMTFPSLSYLGRFSPFECPPPQFEKAEQREKTREKNVKSSTQEKSQTPLNCSPSPWRPRKKDTSYCECCQQPFTNLDEHLQTDQHRMFVLDSSNYSVVDQLVLEMLPGFNLYRFQQSEETVNRPPTPLPIQDVCELETLTDIETESAVQALRRQGSSFNTHISSPIRGPLPFGPASLSEGFQFPIPCPATPPANIQSCTPTEFPKNHPHLSSPAMPVLDVEPQAHASVRQQLFPCLGTPCSSPDPYSMPPALSPQFPFSSYILHSPYSEPPVLSPKPYITEEAVEGVICEMDTAESLSECVSAATVPILISHPPPVAMKNAEVKGPNQDSHLVFSESREREDLECDKLLPCRSQSLPRPPATVPNSKKRCRSASPGCSSSKRSRMAEHGHLSAKQGRDIIAEPEGRLLSDKPPCQVVQCSPQPKATLTCMAERLDLKQTFTKFSAPIVHKPSSAPSHIDILGHGSTSVAALSKSRASDPPLQCPKDKSQIAYSSQDSQRSLSHSTSVHIESALIPDLATLSPSSSDSDWDRHLLSRLGPTSVTPALPTEQDCELDKELLHRRCTWMHDTSYESHLHTVLQPSTPATSLCGEEMDSSVFSRTVVQIVEVQH